MWVGGADELWIGGEAEEEEGGEQWALLKQGNCVESKTAQIATALCISTVLSTCSHPHQANDRCWARLNDRSAAARGRTQSTE